MDELECACTLALELAAGISRTFFQTETGEQCEKPLESALQAKLLKELPNEDLGEILEDFHRELERQRSARQTGLLDHVSGENLEDLPKHHDEELECQ